MGYLIDWVAHEVAGQLSRSQLVHHVVNPGLDAGAPLRLALLQRRALGHRGGGGRPQTP
jgi:hypothetical protein